MASDFACLSLLLLAQRQTEAVHKGAENEEAMFLIVCGVCLHF